MKLLFAWIGTSIMYVAVTILHSVHSSASIASALALFKSLTHIVHTRGEHQWPPSNDNLTNPNDKSFLPYRLLQAHTVDPWWHCSWSQAHPIWQCAFFYYIILIDSVAVATHTHTSSFLVTMVSADGSRLDADNTSLSCASCNQYCLH